MIMSGQQFLFILLIHVHANVVRIALSVTFWCPKAKYSWILLASLNANSCKLRANSCHTVPGQRPVLVEGRA